MVLALIFGFLPDAERICTITLVCKNCTTLFIAVLFGEKLILIFNDDLLQMPWESLSSPEREKLFKVSAITWIGEIFATFYADAETLKFWFWPGLDTGNKLFLQPLQRR